MVLPTRRGAAVAEKNQVRNTVPNSAVIGQTTAMIRMSGGRRITSAATIAAQTKPRIRKAMETASSQSGTGGVLFCRRKRVHPFGNAETAQPFPRQWNRKAPRRLKGAGLFAAVARQDPVPAMARASAEYRRALAENNTSTRNKPARKPPGKVGKGRISAHEVEEVEDRSSPRTPIIYEIVRRLGEEEMARPAVSLWWSGIAAGISISFSLLAEALLQMHLPDAPWRPLVVSFGYSVGFLMVVLSRQQLFTENTITVVLPVVATPTRDSILTMTRMWAIVFLANMAGTLFAALFCTYAPVLSPDVLATMRDISLQAMNHDWPSMFFRAIGAGFLVAAMVWLLPSATSSQFQVITLMTWLIALGGFAHIVAGSVEAFVLVASGDLGLLPMIVNFTIPVLLGNVVGGTALFALLSYAQVMKEI